MKAGVEHLLSLKSNYKITQFSADGFLSISALAARIHALPTVLYPKPLFKQFKELYEVHTVGFEIES